MIRTINHRPDDFPGYYDRDSELRTLIRDTRTRLKATATRAELDELSPGWKPPLTSIAVQRMRTAGAEI